jgi:ribose transport system ATP-binding protein
MTLGGEAAGFRNPRQAQRAGVAYVPGDRNREGLLPIRPILENLQLPGWRSYGTPLSLKRARSDADAAVNDLAIKIATLDEPVANLSGGNAQKVVIGKWLMREPRLLLLDDPTKGVDVNAKAEFYRLLRRLQQQGTTILFHSSDDAELLGLCQRVIVLQDGHVRAELTGETLDKESLVAASMGASTAVSAP